MPRLRRCALGLFVLLTFLWPPAVVLAQGARAGVVTTLEGNVTAARAGLPQPVGLRFKDDVFLNDRIVAGDRSLARLLLGGKAVVTVRERSALTITEVPGRSTIQLDSGKIAVAVAREKMRAGESIEVRTPNAVAAVRGTVFVTEVTQATAALDAAQAAVTTNIYGFADQVLVTMAGRLFTVGPNMFLTGTGFQPPTLGTMTADVRARALAGLQARAQQVGAGQEGAKDQAVGTTVATFSAGPPPEVVAPPTPQAVTPPTPQQNQAPILPGGNQNLESSTPSPSGGGAGFKPSGTPTGILVFGDRGPGSTLSADLASFGRTVAMNVTTLPADLSSFGTIWHVSAFTALTAAEQTRLADFLALGRGLHLTGERPCCETLNASLQTLVRSVVVGGSSIQVGGLGDIGGPYDFNSSARGGITTAPNALTTWNPNGPGGISGISGANVLVTGAGGVAVGAVWDSGDLVGGSGRLTLLMDSDWIFGSGGSERLPVIENIQTYIDDPPATLGLSGSLFKSTGERLDTGSTFLTIDGYTVTSSGSDPLLWFSGSTVTTAGDFVRVSDSAVSGNGSFVRLEDGAEIIQTSLAEPLVSMRGGSLSMDGHLFELAGRASATAVDPETGLTLGTDRPLQPGSESPVFRADDGATVSVGRSAYRVDTALLEATAPLLALAGGSTLVTGSHAVDLIGQAKVSIPNDAVAMISLNASALTVVNGNLVNVGGGSVLNVAGSLVSLANGSTLNVLNGLLLNVSGGSAANIGKSLVSFSGSGNVLSVTNSFAPTALIGGIPVSGPADSFKITAPSALAGLGTAGSVKINGVTLTPTTPLASLSGSLIAVRSGGTVKIGP